jgi:membrane-bound serine protease (ClpP class)
MYRVIIGMILMCPFLLNTAQTRSEQSIITQSVIQVPVLAIDGAIGPAVSDYLIREITKINLSRQAPVIFITIDTPGGLSSSLRDINQRILSSDIPIACLVHPQGARAASAGTYILYACHVAAMATATTLGAATPVMISGPMPGPKQDQPEGTKPSAMENKVLNDSIAYIRSLAQLRQRNEEWAELAVSEAATLTAIEALEMNVIDLMAESPEQLLSSLSDPTLRINQNGQQFDLTDARLDYRTPDWRSQFIATITNPNVAYILMLVGVYGLLLEFYSPGIGVAGVTGAISLFIGLYAFQMLPLNYAGLGLLMLGIAFLIIESMVPSVGVFGIGGLVAFVIGSIFLIDTDQQQFKVSLQLIAAIALSSGLFIVFVLGYLWRIRKNKVVSGQESMLGAQAAVMNDFSGQGYVQLNGERWAAYTKQPLKRGQVVFVEAIDGLTLVVSSNTVPNNISGGSHEGDYSR